MNINEAWDEFLEKLRNDSFIDSDFSDDAHQFLFPFLSGKQSQLRRDKFLNSPYTTYAGEERKCVVVNCIDSDYRFDFYVGNGCWQLCFIECITLPVHNIETLPYENYISLPEQEVWIRAERDISKTINFYCKLKTMLGANEALLWFKDGSGEFLCAKSWVPFYEGARAFIAHSAWIASRIHGEKVAIDEFSEKKCVLRFVSHLYFRIYHVTTHIKLQLAFDEYTALFEYIWKDRAFCAGWEVTFNYTNEDTTLTFIRVPSRTQHSTGSGGA